MSRTPTTPWRSRITGSGTLKVAEAKPHALNFRLHPTGQSQALAASLDSVGWVQQVVVNTTTGNLLDGHLRVELARERGEAELPCLYVELSADEERLVLASLDPIAAMAGADREKLQELLSSIQSKDEQVRGLLEQIARQERVELPAMPGLVDPDEVPEVPAEPVSRLGDLWLLGPHKLLCGDSTEPASVERLMAGGRALAMITDPPYLVDYDGGNHPQTWGEHGTTAEQKTKHWDAYTDHEQAVGFYRDFIAVALAEALGERPAIYQWFGMMRMDVVTEAWTANRVKLHQVLIWHKSRPVLGRCWFMWDYEPCAVGWLEGRQPQPERRPPANTRAVWDVDQKEGIEEGLGSVHPTIKAVELIRRPIRWHTRPGELIYEPFSGSGTAIIAAEMTGRRCYALELAPAFVDVALLRWQRYSGKEATLEGDGRSFTEISAERSSGNASQGNATP
jgi:DNA modification methylase